MPHSAALNSQLIGLQSEYLSINQLIRTTNKTTYEHLGHVYLWWRKASQVEGYLQGLYDAAGIKH